MPPRADNKMPPAVTNKNPAVKPQRRRAAAPAPLFFNRELSQLEFNSRVQAQAEDERVPLLERVRYLGICSSNLDEFFEIRVASLKQQIVLSQPITGPDGRSPQEALARIRVRASQLIEAQYACWSKTLRPALKRQGIRLLGRTEWKAPQTRWLQDHFRREILPVLSPLGLDPAHPFPRILNKSLNLAVTLTGRDAFGREGNVALVRAPRSLPRVIELPAAIAGSGQEFVLLSAVLQEFVGELFPGMQVKGSYQFRVTRDSELIVDEDEVENLALALRDELMERGYADAVRLEVAAKCPLKIVDFLARHFGLGGEDVYRCAGPVNLNRVAQLYDMIDRPELKFPPFAPRIPELFTTTDSPFEAIRARDVLLHHPFDSFAPVVELVRHASVDPDVLAIKQTLYRAGKDSPLVAHLIQAARNGKDVTVVVELRARFDEDTNIALADRLQEAGVQVVYGVVGYKTHAKMLLIVRREPDGLNRYTHLSTGNYHTRTTRTYTDIGLLTAHPGLASDVNRMFQQLSGLGPVIKLDHLLQSPFTLHQALLAKIEREADHARAGRPARIIAKINALNDPEMIRALYAASSAGVSIDLIVRGTCALRPGIPGVSARIRVISVIDRFLEHSRVYCFDNGGATEVWCSSADWLERNLSRRVETCFPILVPELAVRVREEALDNYLADTRHAWQLRPDGEYTRVLPREGIGHSAQQCLLDKITR